MCLTISRYLCTHCFMILSRSLQYVSCCKNCTYVHWQRELWIRRRRMRRKLMAKLSQWHYSLNSNRSVLLLSFFFHSDLSSFLLRCWLKTYCYNLFAIINWYTHDRLVISFFLSFYLYLVIRMSFFFLPCCLLLAGMKENEKDSSQAHLDMCINIAAISWIVST